MSFYTQLAKYKNKKTIIDGVEFDSKLEAERYIYLKCLLKASEIKNLSLQVPFEVQKKFELNGKIFRAIKYVTDFVYEIDTKEQGKIAVVEDAKGMRTALYQLKKKLFLKEFGDKFRFIEISRKGKGFSEKIIN